MSHSSLELGIYTWRLVTDSLIQLHITLAVTVYAYNCHDSFQLLIIGIIDIGSTSTFYFFVGLNVNLGMEPTCKYRCYF
jgi:hypothetical protein